MVCAHLPQDMREREHVSYRLEIRKQVPNFAALGTEPGENLGECCTHSQSVSSQLSTCAGLPLHPLLYPS